MVGRHGSDNNATLRTTHMMTLTRYSPGCRNRLAHMLLPAFALMFVGSAWAQLPVPASAAPANEAPELKLDAPDKKLFLSTTRIETRSADGKRGGVGTGFLFNYNSADRRDIQFIVTCRHVVEGFASATLSFAQRKDGKPNVEESCQVEVPNLRNLVFYDPDPGLDVALIPLKPVLQHSYTNSATPYIQMLGEDLIPNRAAAERLSAIQPVVFVGYPDGVRDEKSPLPVARRGFTASPYVVDFAGLPVFLIDADIAPGSSGSPVIVLDQDANRPQTSTTSAGGLRFLGMLSDTYFQTVNGEPKFQRPSTGTPAPREPRSPNLGAVIKPQAILRTISDYIKIHPLTAPDESDQPSKN